ncbi:MAG: hypothetical protein J5W83_16475, partial [Candidatus Accumulibacter sp.]|nr:hypothetical protein [Accumulibacter sp.]
MDIRCRPLSALQLGILQLPRLDVSIAFAGGRAEEQAAFIADFQRHFRRGAGSGDSLRRGGSPPL